MERPDKCDIECPCKDTGLIEVQNQGQFETDAETVFVPCVNPIGHWIHYHRYRDKRTVQYDPNEMAMVGEPPLVFQKQMF